MKDSGWNWRTHKPWVDAYGMTADGHCPMCGMLHDAMYYSPCPGPFPDDVVLSGGKSLKIGLDLDGTVYAYPDFFRDLIDSFYMAGHRFFCTSSHARSEWPEDCERLRKLGIDPDKISPDLMYAERHGHIHLKAKQADRLDLVFDDDSRIQSLTSTPIFCPGNGAERCYNYAGNRHEQ